MFRRIHIRRGLPSAKCASSVLRLHRHKAVLSPVALTLRVSGGGAKRLRSESDSTRLLGLHIAYYFIEL